MTAGLSSGLHCYAISSSRPCSSGREKSASRFGRAFVCGLECCPTRRELFDEYEWVLECVHRDVVNNDVKRVWILPVIFPIPAPCLSRTRWA